MENEREIKKFKDKQALERAYGALEREFTRKCQRLRELERLLGTMEEKIHTELGARLRRERQRSSANGAICASSLKGNGRPRP